MHACTQAYQTLTDSSASQPASSSEQGSAAALEGLNLGLGDGGAPEAGGQLVAVKVDALRGLDGAQVGAGGAADAGVGGGLDGLAEGAELLSVVAVGAEGAVGGGLLVVLGEVLGEGVGGRGRVRMGRVVDGCWGGELAD